MRKRTVLRLVSALLLLALLCCGCGAANDEAAQGSAETDSAAYDELVFPLIVSGETPEHLDEVEDALNAYVTPKIDAVIRFEPVELSTLEDFYLRQPMSSRKVDFICLLPAETQLFALVDAGLLRPLDELLPTYAPHAQEAAADVLEVGQMNGVQYLIPQVKDTYTMGTSIEYNAALVEKYQLDISSVRAITELEPLLAIIHENEPDVIPFTSSSAATGYTQLLSGYDNLIDTLGVLNLRAEDSLTVADWYETDEFMALCQLMHKWYQAGYIAPDTLTTQTSGAQLVASGQAFCSISTIMPTGDYGADTGSGSAVVEVQLTDQPQLLTSYQAGLESIGISSYCEAPEKAMRFLDLLYSDAYVVNLLQYGIEGENYTRTKDGLIDNGGDYFLLFGQPSNQTLRAPSTDDGTDYAEKYAAYAQRDTVSPAFGFVFDQSAVSREISLCKAVVEQYYPVIDCGCVDPEIEIPKFVQALKNAGIDKILAEKQRQLDAWQAK